MASAERRCARSGMRVVHVLLDCGLPALRCRNHQLFARAYHFAFAFEHALLAVGVEPFQQRNPFVFASHAAQPVLAAEESVIADHAFDAMVDRSDVDWQRPTGAARSEQSDAVGINLGSRLHVGDAVSDILRLPHRQNEAALAFAVAEAAIVEHENGVAGLGETAVIALIELGVVQTEPAGSLDNSRPRPVALVGQSQQSLEFAALAVKMNFFLFHL